MTHPALAELALFAGGDHGVFSGWRIRLHLNRCERCREEVRAFREAREKAVDLAGALPEGLNWQRLAGEMTANIRVGLAAAECVPVRPAPERRLGWRPVTALASATMLVATGWWLTMPRPNLGTAGVKAQPAPEAVVNASSGGIELNRNGRTLTLLNSGEAVVLVNAQGTARSRYVDSETGQVTINHVYTE